MTDPQKGDVVLLRPHTQRYQRSDALVLDVQPGVSFCVALVPDLHLAGHLDLILDSEYTQLDYGVAALSHIGTWVDNGQVVSIDGHVPTWVVEAIESARLGVQPSQGRTGIHPIDSAYETRWPTLRTIAVDFGRAFSIAQAPDETQIMSISSWKKKYASLLDLCDDIADRRYEMDEKDAVEILFSLQVLGDWLELHPSVYPFDTFLRDTDYIRNAARRARTLEPAR